MIRYFLLSLLIICLETFPSLAETTRTIQVLGHGEIKTEPDIARVHLAVTIISKDLLKAKKDVDKAMAGILDVAKQLNIAPDDVTASQLQVSSKEHYQTNEFLGYETTRSVTIILRQITKLDELLTACIQVGANRVDGIHLETSKEKELRAKAIGLAVEDAKSLARDVATGFGAKVGKVQTIAAENNSAVTTLSAPVEGLSANTYKPSKIVITAALGVVFQLE